MIVHEVVGESAQIDFGATGIAEILQNIRMIITNPAFSIPMARDFAYVPELDLPYQVAQARNVSRITQSIHQYEPRAQVEKVYFKGEPLEGKLIPVVRVRVDDET